MKRYEILIWVVIAGVLVSGAFIVIRNNYSNNQNENLDISKSVNTRARVAASGSPLPAISQEDVVVEQQQFDGRIFNLSYDWQTKNWQLDFYEEGAQQSLRYLVKEEIFLYFNTLDLVWDEVDPQLLDDDFKALIDIDQFLLSSQQIDFFNRVALEEESAPCQQKKADICAVWQANNFQNQGEIFIYVNKQTRKIDHIVSVNLADKEGGSILATYFYEPVEIQLPPSDQVRYLSDD